MGWFMQSVGEMEKSTALSSIPANEINNDKIIIIIIV